MCVCVSVRLLCFPAGPGKAGLIFRKCLGRLGLMRTVLPVCNCSTDKGVTVFCSSCRCLSPRCLVLLWWVILLRFLLSPPLKRRCSKDRTKMQRDDDSWYFNEGKTIHEETTKIMKWNNENRNSPIWCKHKDRNNHPRNTHRIWLPKYGSQSETMIITWLWLRTASGSHRLRRHPTKPLRQKHTTITHVTPWPDEINKENTKY